MYDRLSIRPTINTTYEAENPNEQFQNKTLRPILKMQNDLICRMYLHYMEKRKVPFYQMSTQKRFEQIAHSVSKDNRLRGLLFGMVVGMFTLVEMDYYRQYEGEINRRITSLVIQRLESQLG